MAEQVPFLEALQDVSAGNAKIPQAKFRSVGSLAVVDQGQSVIAGYTNDISAAVKTAAPVIVFGDHTRTLKYVDFPFAMGADGVKVLRTQDGFEPKFVYRYLQSRPIPSAGYSRHFKFLKEMLVPKPPLDEQRHIATILDHADRLRSRVGQALAYVDELTASIFNDMFAEGRWASVPLAEAVREGTLVTYGIVQAGDEFRNGVPYIRTGDIVAGQIRTANLRRADPQIAARFERSTVRTGDIVMSIRATVGTTAIVPTEIDGANLTQGTARIAPSDRVLGPYLLECLRSAPVQRWIQAQVKGATFREITLGRLRELLVPVPPIDLQQEFASRVTAVESQRAALLAQKSACDALFVSLQFHAFRGEL
jgi:type I restriction enzyme, S subunit